MKNFIAFLKDFEKYSMPNFEENKIILSYIIIGGLIFGFSDYYFYRDLNPERTYSIYILLFSLFSVLIAVYINVFFQKAYALARGLKAIVKFNPWKFFITILLGILSYGFIPLTFTPDFSLKKIRFKRVGVFKYDIAFKDYSKIAFAGITGNLIIILLLKIFFGFNNILVNGIMAANAFTAISTIIPLPKNTGFYAFLYSISNWGLLLGYSIITILLIIHPNIWFSLTAGLIITIALWYFLITEYEGFKIE